MKIIKAVKREGTTVFVTTEGGSEITFTPHQNGGYILVGFSLGYDDRKLLQEKFNNMIEQNLIEVVQDDNYKPVIY